MKHTISIVVENRFGAFDRVATLFSGKGFNLESISIGETEIKGLSRMTIVTSGDEVIIQQIIKQLNRLIDTIKVVELTETDRTERELMLISLNYNSGSLENIKNICDIFRGNIVDINSKSVMLEITGPPAKINAAVNVLAPFGIKDVARSGTVALKRGEQLEHKVKDKEL
jgi:acetolactate synthase-1/3 small subunit